MKKIRPAALLDFALLSVLLPLMGYSLVGEAFHEAAGVVLLALIAVHVRNNRIWLKSLARGRYGAARIVRTACFAALLMAILAQAASGLLLNIHLFPFLSIEGTSYAARKVHLCAAYWCFTLMAVHAGMHLKKSISRLKKKLPPLFFRFAGMAFALAGMYGSWAFYARGVAGYMFLQNSFAFFDFDAPLLLFFADYAAVFCLFALAGHLAVHVSESQERSPSIQ